MTDSEADKLLEKAIRKLTKQPMTQEHPITPPPELVREWQVKIEYCSKRADREAVVAKIFQLGADMELEACCEWLETGPYGFSIEATAPDMTKQLRAIRRPKLPPETIEVDGFTYRLEK